MTEDAECTRTPTYPGCTHTLEFNTTHAAETLRTAPSHQRLNARHIIYKEERRVSTTFEPGIGNCE